MGIMDYTTIERKKGTMATALTWGLADILHKKNMSQRELSRQTAITREAIGRMYNGKTVRAELPIIAKLVETLGVPIGALLVQTPSAPQPAKRVTSAPTPAKPTPMHVPAAPTPVRQSADQSPRAVHYAITGERIPAMTEAERAEDLARLQARATLAAAPPLPPKPTNPPAHTEDAEDAEDELSDEDYDPEESAELQELLDKLEADPSALLTPRERFLCKEYDIDPKNL
jgi:DNA-binding Xre family transcriptional regulator